MAIPPSGADPFLAARLDFLAKTQNPDGGWGYFPAKQSWIEPTAWATLALHERGPQADRAWELILSWQGPDGSWRPSRDVYVNSWVTALCVTICQVKGEFGEPFKRGLHWLLQTYDAEATLFNKALTGVGVSIGRNPNHKAWPWKPGNSSWIEPTAHSLVALKLARKRLDVLEINERIVQGEAAILDQKCQDGGWNYGNNKVLSVFLPSYPETTALALVGLQQRDVGASVQFAEGLLSDRGGPPPGRLASAWLSIALRLHGRTPPPSRFPELESNSDILVTALEAIGAPGGTFRLLQTGGSK